MWWVAGQPKSECLANSFLKLCFCLLKSVGEWTTSPGCHVSQLVCAKHTLCLYSELWPPVPLVSALFWVLQDSLPSPLLPSPCLLVGHCSFSNLQAAPLRQPLTAPISLCGSRPALLHREDETLVPSRRLGNVTLQRIPLTSGVFSCSWKQHLKQLFELPVSWDSTAATEFEKTLKHTTPVEVLWKLMVSEQQLDQQ